MGGVPLSACLVAAAGLAGWQIARDKRRRDDEAAAQEAALAALFADNDDDLPAREDDADALWGAISERLANRDASLCSAADDLCESMDWQESRYANGAPALTCALAECAAEPAMRNCGSSRVARGNAAISRHFDRRAVRRCASRKRRSIIGPVWLAACLVLAGWLGWGQSRPNSSALRITNASAVSAPSRTQNIELVRVGQRVVGENPDLGQSDHSTQTAVDPAMWRLVRMHREDRWRDGTLDTLEIETLQPLTWIQEHGARPGRHVPVPVDLTEMGMDEGAEAEVVAIEPCPTIADGPGHVVLTTVNHLNRLIVELTVEDGDGRRDTIKPTAFHKFYSDTRRAWVSAVKLKRGERLRGLNGPVTLVGCRRVSGTERIYNMSIEGQHVYHVSALGVLVHNPDCPPNLGDFGGDGANLNSGAAQSLQNNLAQQEIQAMDAMQAAAELGTAEEAFEASQAHLNAMNAADNWAAGGNN